MVAVLLALLAVLAISIAAATIDEPGGGSGGVGTGDTESAGIGSEPFAIDFSPDDPTSTSPPGWLVEWFGRLLFLLFALASLYTLYQFYREHGVRGIATVAGVGVVLAGLFYLLLEPGGGGDGLNRSGGSPNNTSIIPAGGVPGASDAAVPATDPPTVLAAIFGLALLAAGIVLVRATGDDEFTPEPEPLPDEGGDVEAVGRVAGEAADRIARGAVADNEIYRAWREMTDHLDVANPQSSTPSEFAAAAVDAGMAREDVEALTGLFEAVRYGGEAVTEEREEAALDALRNIEAGYA